MKFCSTLYSTFEINKLQFLLKDAHDVNDAELARKLHENERGLRARRQTTARKSAVSLWRAMVHVYARTLVIINYNKIIIYWSCQMFFEGKKKASKSKETQRKQRRKERYEN